MLFLCFSAAYTAAADKEASKSAAAAVLEQVLGRRTVAYDSPMQLSPDGRLLAVTLRGAHDLSLPERVGHAPEGASIAEALLGCEVVLVDTKTKQIRQPFDEGAASWSPVWSPNGKLLAAYVGHHGPPCLAVWNAETGKQRLYRDATVLGHVGFELPQWTADSKSLVFQHCPAADANKQKIVQVLKHTADAAEGKTDGRNDARSKASAAAASTWDWLSPERSLVKLDCESGQKTVLCPKIRTYGWRISPDGRQVAFLNRVGSDDAAAQSYSFRLTVAAMDGSGHLQVAPQVDDRWGSATFSWSPDSRTLALIAHGESQPRSVHVVDVAAATAKPSAVECLSAEGKPLSAASFEWWGSSPAPVWSSSGDEFAVLAGHAIHCYSPQGKLIRTYTPCGLESTDFTWLRPVNESGSRLQDTALVMHRQGIKRIDLSSQATTDLITAWPESLRPRGSLPAPCVVTPDAAKCYYVAESKLGRAQLCAIDFQQKSVEAVAELCPGLEEQRLGKLQTIEWRTAAGKKCQGALLLPAGYRVGQPLPTIVEVYAGATDNGRLTIGDVASRWAINPHVLNAAGYAAFRPDLPLEGAGPYRQIPELLKAATDRVVELGFADRERIGLVGNSFGCYSVLSVVSQTDRYQAAVASNGTVDLVRTATEGGFGWTERGQGGMKDSLWQARERYVNNSPLYFLDRVNTPVLLVRGGADLASQGHLEAAFNSLVRLDKPVELRVYPGQGHWPPSWARESQRDFHARVIDWFDQHLKPAELKD